MARTRAFRRYKYKIRKLWVRKQFRRWDFFGNGYPSDFQVGFSANTPHPCSCWMCGNPRKYSGRLTRQEQCSIYTLNDEM